MEFCNFFTIRRGRLMKFQDIGVPMRGTVEICTGGIWAPEEMSNSVKSNTDYNKIVYFILKCVKRIRVHNITRKIVLGIKNPIGEKTFSLSGEKSFLLYL